MRKLLIILMVCAMMVIGIGCKGLTGTDGNGLPPSQNLDILTIDVGDDVYFLMGMDDTLFQKILNQDAVEIYEQNPEERMSEHYYQFKNGVTVNISYDQVISVGTFYYDDSLEYPVPTLLGINGEDDYESVISKLGTPYYDDPDSSPPSVVYSVQDRTYIKIFFDSETGKVAYISCFNE